MVQAGRVIFWVCTLVTTVTVLYTGADQQHGHITSDNVHLRETVVKDTRTQRSVHADSRIGIQDPSPSPPTHSRPPLPQPHPPPTPKAHSHPPPSPPPPSNHNPPPSPDSQPSPAPRKGFGAFRSTNTDHTHGASGKGRSTHATPHHKSTGTVQNDARHTSAASNRPAAPNATSTADSSDASLSPTSAPPPNTTGESDTTEATLESHARTELEKLQFLVENGSAAPVGTSRAAAPASSAGMDSRAGGRHSESGGKGRHGGKGGHARRSSSPGREGAAASGTTLHAVAEDGNSTQDKVEGAMKHAEDWTMDFDANVHSSLAKLSSLSSVVDMRLQGETLDSLHLGDTWKKLHAPRNRTLDGRQIAVDGGGAGAVEEEADREWRASGSLMFSNLGSVGEDIPDSIRELTDDSEGSGNFKVYERGKLQSVPDPDADPENSLQDLDADSTEVQDLLARRGNQTGVVMKVVWPPLAEAGDGEPDPDLDLSGGQEEAGASPRIPVQLMLNKNQFQLHGSAHGTRNHSNVAHVDYIMQVTKNATANQEDGYVVQRVLHRFLFHKRLVPMLPARDPEWRFSKCALVSNSGQLLRAGFGDEIDGAEAVFRINYPPIQGFQKFVGSKCTFEVVNMHHAQLIANRQHPLVHKGSRSFRPPRGGRSLGNATLVVLESTNSENWRFGLLPKLLGNFRPPHTQILSPDFVVAAEDMWQRVYDLADADGNTRCRAMERRAERTNEARKAVVPNAGICKPTSGWFALLLAAQVCEEVHMYGFSSWRKHGTDTQAKYHYFDDVPGVTNVHSFEVSLKVYKMLAQHYNIFVH